MHELVVVERLLELVLETAEQHGARTIRAAELAIGALSCVQEDSLRFGFEALSRDTAASGCALRVTRVPAAVACRDCGREAELADALVLACPACHSREVALVRGRELQLTSIDVDDAAGDETDWEENRTDEETACAS